jgi:pheromone shutdown protein TraB
VITIIGVAHVFNIAEPVAFIIKHLWPDAVLVELDETRYKIMSGEYKTAEPTEAQKKEMSKLYRRTAEYQDGLSKEYGSSTGAEMLMAVNAGKTLGAEIGFIDQSAVNVLDEVWEGMSFWERRRYSWSLFTDKLKGRKKAEMTAAEFARDSDAMIEDMRRKFPTLVRKLIDERNESMAERIKEFASRRNNIVVVVGDAHVEGLVRLLEGHEVRKIRLETLLDKPKMNELRSELWNREV